MTPRYDSYNRVISVDYSDVNGGYSVTFAVQRSTSDGLTLIPSDVSRGTDFVALREAVAFCLEALDY